MFPDNWVFPQKYHCFISMSEINAREDVEESKSSYAVCGSVNWCSYYGKIVWSFFKKLKIELLHDSAISLLNIYMKKIETGNGQGENSVGWWMCSKTGLCDDYLIV